MKVKIKKLNPNAVIPSYAKEGDAGLDLVATSKVYDKYGNIAYGTGLALEIPEGHVGLLFPRSSISKIDIALTNSIGVIDSGYRGEIMVKFKPTLNIIDFVSDDVNLSVIKGQDRDVFDAIDVPAPETYEDYQVGDRVCQLIIMPYPHIDFQEVDTLSETERGEGSFGHSGK